MSDEAQLDAILSRHMANLSDILDEAKGMASAAKTDEGKRIVISAVDAAVRLRVPNAMTRMHLWPKVWGYLGLHPSEVAPKAHQQEPE